MLFLSVILLLKVSAAFAYTATPEKGGPFVITNVHTGLAIDLLDKDMEETSPLVANYESAPCFSISQLWYSEAVSADGPSVMVNGHYPGNEVFIASEGDRVLASPGSVDIAAPLVFQHLPGNVTLITIGGLAVTSGRPGQELKLAAPRAHDKRQQWRFTVVG